ncbi:MAG: hypothetical protein LBR38_02700 [Synergistaceae bacterium]|nr:hypothetical protein [Synergistaceae bacterium]
MLLPLDFPRAICIMGTARHGTARHGTARHGTARHGTLSFAENLPLRHFTEARL